VTHPGGGPDHTDLRVRVQPRASRTEVVGLQGGSLKVRLTTPPVEGAANRELERFLAKVLGLPRSSVELLRGATSREKLVRVRGLSPEEVRERLGV
jgi:uncharacterized protein